MQTLRQKEQMIFRSIPGMFEVLHAEPAQASLIHSKYPDAVFAIHVADNLFQHDRELSLIMQKAYFSIINGDNIADVRLRYEKDTNEYWSKHMWDD